jgi:hypothetical protein
MEETLLTRGRARYCLSGSLELVTVAPASALTPHLSTVMSRTLALSTASLCRGCLCKVLLEDLSLVSSSNERIGGS